jgi:hypothetical protein
MIYAPLWQDIYFETSAYTVLNYSVRTDNTTGTTQYIIYKGKAYSQPNLGMISIKMNPICEKYMGNTLPENWLTNAQSSGTFGFSPVGYIKEFWLFNDDTETVLESYSFRYTFDEEFQWHKYDTYSDLETDFPDLSDYITEADYNNMFPDGFILGKNTIPSTYPFYIPSQTSGTRSIKQMIPGIGHSESIWRLGAYKFSTSLYPNQFGSWVDYITKVNSYSSNYCKGDMAVYYLGKCGCWNDFVFTGTVKRTDDITHYDYGTDGYNRMTGNPEYSATIIRYCNETITKFECTTGWLDDTNSEYFAQDLMPSIRLMIHDLKKNKIYPAVIEDTSVETKKFLNNKEMNKYTVTFRVARDNYIR